MSRCRSPVASWHPLLGALILLATFCTLTDAINTSGAASKSGLSEFRYCLRQAQHPNLRECIGRTAMSFLQRFDERDNFTLLEDFVVRKDENAAGRSLVNVLDTDPVDFRGILENAGAVVSQRSLQWHMDAVYPGLMLRVGPTGNTNSLVEFVLDPNVSERQFGYEEPSTARVLAKQYLLPFLLGLKFNLVALVPLLFAGVCLLLKKSLFFAKLAIYVSGLLGVGGVAGALGSFGGLGGLVGSLGAGGFGGGLLGPPPLHGHGHSLDAGGAAGYFPGKATVYNQYDSDELNHNSPYKRTDRKVNFHKPRELDPRQVGATTPNPVALDHFYDYEKQVHTQDRNGKVRGKLGPSAAYGFAGAADPNFPVASERLGWKVAEVISPKLKKVQDEYMRKRL